MHTGSLSSNNLPYENDNNPLWNEVAKFERLREEEVIEGGR